MGNLKTREKGSAQILKASECKTGLGTSIPTQVLSTPPCVPLKLTPPLWPESGILLTAPFLVNLFPLLSEMMLPAHVRRLTPSPRRCHNGICVKRNWKSWGSPCGKHQRLKSPWFLHSMKSVAAFILIRIIPGFATL